MPRRIYLDHNATTPIHPEVLAEMQRVLAEVPGNPSSPHHFGREARQLIDGAREDVARFLRVDPGEIFFTSGGTEANNLLVLGDPEVPFWTTAVEHPSVTGPARASWASGRVGALLPVEAPGQLPAASLESEDLSEAWVSIQWVNNETGFIQDVAGWARKWRVRGARVHTDGAQGFFRRPERLDDLDVDAATLTAHKSFGPTGVGVLFLRAGTILEPLQHGGPQERRLRPGTETVPAIAGLGALARLAEREDLWPEEQLLERQTRFRDQLSAIEGLAFVTPEEGAAPNTLLVTLDDLHAETVLAHLDRAGVAASSGSACASGADRPSPVLRALGLPDRAIRGAVRFSFGPATDPADLDEAARSLATITRQLRRTTGA